MAPISFIVWSFGDEAGLVSVFFKKLYSMFGFDYVQRAEKVRRPCNYWKRIHLNAGVSEYWVLAEAKATGLKAKRLLYFL